MGLLEDILQNPGVTGLLGPQMSQESSPTEYISQILNQHKDKNFVQRLLKPDLYPNMELGPRQVGTHLMSYSQDGDRYLVYPEIIQGEDGNLRRLDRKEAAKYAVKTGEYIPFNTPEEADWFGKNYKQIWGGEYKP